MERVHFLRKPTGLIIVRVNHKHFPSGRFHFSTGQNITDTNWNDGSIKRDQPVKGITTFQSVRKYFDAIRNVCDTHLNGHIQESRLRNELLELSKRQPKQDGFFDQYEKIIETTKTAKGKPITDGSKRSKRQSMRKLMQFNPDLTFADITIDFYYEYSKWLEEKFPKTAGKHLKELKAIMNQADDRGIKVPQDFRKKSFRAPRSESESTYLSMDEIEKVFKTEVPSHLEKVRDVFVLAACTGQRIGDWPQLRLDNVEDDLLKIVQEKTGATVYIPIHDLVRIIWNKYNGLPELLSDQKFNVAIKEVCQLAKLGKIVINGNLDDKYLHISSHTARRSFASNAFLEGMEVLSIRQLTGHKSESTFLKYIRLDAKQHGQKASKHSFFVYKMKKEAA